MTDKKSLAIILGAVIGVTAVGVTAAYYMSRSHEPIVNDINDIFDKARQTVKKLDEAVDSLKNSAA